MSCGNDSEVRAALYARVSTDQQAREGTIASQVEALRCRAQADGVAVPPERQFVDDGCSGSTLVRPALERLRDLAACGGFERLYVLSPDRLARNFAHQAVLVEELKADGVELVLLNRAVSNTPEDALLLQVQGVLAEYERAKILERCRRGRLHAARVGNLSVMSIAAYGYRYVPAAEAGGRAQLNIHLPEAAVVREIFDWVGRERVSLCEVARRLEARQVPSPKGKPRWHASTLSRMLANPLYKGQAAYGKVAMVAWSAPPRPRRGTCGPPKVPRSSRAVPPDQWVLMPAPALVDSELFDAVAGQLEENAARLRSSQPGGRYILAGLTVCGCCGYAFIGRYSSATGRRRYLYYRCGCPRDHACPNRSVPAAALEEAVWQDVRALLAEPQRVEREYRRRLEGGDARRGPDPQAEARRVNAGIERLIDAYEQGLLDKSQFESRIARSRQRLDQLRQEQQAQVQTEQERQQMRLAIDQLEAFAQKVNSGLADADAPTRRQILRTLVRKVEVNREDVRIVYRVGLGPFDRAPVRGRLQDRSGLYTDGRCPRRYLGSPCW